MNSIELGKRIKEARLAKKMTQSELVGSFITRNMLSQIESGAALPSVKTLEYLAERLELPVGSFMDTSDNEEISDGIKSNLLSAKSAFIKGDYATAAELARPLINSDYDDEGCAILARCMIKNAKSCAENHENTLAVKYAHDAMDYSERGIYKSREISMEALLLLKELADG